jgi:hypothetical protein
MHSDLEEIAHELDHALTAIAVLRRADPGNETLKQIESAMDDAWDELTRPRP